jgi:phosphorylcholine metabolism protein LicD
MPTYPALTSEFDYYIPLAQTPHAAMVLDRGCSILEDLGIHYWLSAGTTLGIVRDGGFIPHDSDLDVASFDITDRFDEMDERFFADGFSEVLFMPYQRAYRFLGVIFDVYSFTTEGDTIVANMPEGKQVKPKRFFTELGSIVFEGRTYPVPRPVEGYLEMRYGDTWRTPKTKKEPWYADAVCLQK